MSDANNTELHRKALERSIDACGLEEDQAFHREGLERHLEEEGEEYEQK